MCRSAGNGGGGDAAQALDAFGGVRRQTLARRHRQIVPGDAVERAPPRAHAVAGEGAGGGGGGLHESASAGSPAPAASGVQGASPSSSTTRQARTALPSRR